MEKTIVIVMDEELFEKQVKEIFELRKTSIQVFEGNLMPIIDQDKDVKRSSIPR